MTKRDLEPCPDCGVLLPKSDGPTHRYIGASAACWAMFSALLNAGEPPLAPGSMNILLIDAYATQHPGNPSPQATQSVAVHLLALYGVLAVGIAPEQALWVRQRALRKGGQAKHGQFHWLKPPIYLGKMTVLDIVQAPTPTTRTEQIAQYVQSVWDVWQGVHLETLRRWYQKFVIADKI